jgi:hypothetical protein
MKDSMQQQFYKITSVKTNKISTWLTEVVWTAIYWAIICKIEIIKILAITFWFFCLLLLTTVDLMIKCWKHNKMEKKILSWKLNMKSSCW